METINLKSGDRVFVRNTLVWYKPMSWLATLIRSIAKIKYNHTGVIVRNWGEPFVNEAIAKGIYPIPASKDLKGKYVRIDRYKYDINEKVFCVKANTKIGNKYDFWGLLWHQLLFQIFHIWVGHTKEFAEDKMYCYEYGAWCFDWVFPEWWKIDPIKYLEHEDFEVIFEGTW